MILKVLATGSKGNCYLLTSDNETLIIDCGIPFKQIKIGLDFDLSNVVGVIVSHIHTDHSLSVKDFEKFGIQVWEPFLDEKKIQKKKIGNFSIQCFDVPHDDCECRGFIIENNDKKLLYATDFEFIPYSFKKLKINSMLIECNYQKEYVEMESNNRTHVLKGHCELNTTIGIIKDNLDSLKNVILCHLSDKNADAKQCVDEVKKIATNCFVDVAEANKIYQI